MTDTTRPIQPRLNRDRHQLATLLGAVLFIGGFIAAAAWITREPRVELDTSETASVPVSTDASSEDSQQREVVVVDPRSGQSISVGVSSSGWVGIMSLAGDVGVRTKASPQQLQDLRRFMDELAILSPNPGGATRLRRGETLTDAFLSCLDDSGLLPLLTDVQRHAAPNSAPIAAAPSGAVGAPRRTIKRVKVSNYTREEFVVYESNPALLRRFAQQLDAYGEFTAFFRPYLLTHGPRVRAECAGGEVVTVDMNGWIPENWRVLLDEACPAAPR